ncbi:hypothetical protein JSY14_09715 [Brachybacterium sp. EF45031]|nr:hypothetical protein [Brachybacterium sillae]
MRPVTALAAAALALATGGKAAIADPAAPALERRSVSAAEADAAEDYWTPARMEAAIPAETLLAENDHIASSEPAAGARTMRPRAAAASPAVTPVDHIGKVFFTIDGTDYVCSANAVVSDNESTVATAGHCAHEGGGSWATNWVFVPAYENGNAPYGAWTAEDLFAPTQWTSEGDMTYDTAFAVVRGEGSATLTDTVGGSGVEFNGARGQRYTSYGYPAGTPFDGETLHQCTGTAEADPTGSTESHGIPCDMTGGSSGGPWFLGDGADGVQNSVNSFGYRGLDGVMFGPYWGAVIEDTYQEAQGS